MFVYKDKLNIKQNGSVKNLIISPPFGNILNLDYASSVCGTYTANKRSGMIYSYLKTFRPVYKNNKIGWVNSIGLKNPGIVNLNYAKAKDKIVSIAFQNKDDASIFYDNLSPFCQNNKIVKAIEINISCPNAKVNLVKAQEIELIKSLGVEVIVKISPTKSYLDLIKYYSDCGVNYFHLFNSFPCNSGGLSGVMLKNLYYNLIKKVLMEFGDSINIISAGGIDSIEDIMKYQKLGIKNYSISTLFLHPIKLFKFIKNYKNIIHNENTFLQ